MKKLSIAIAAVLAMAGAHADTTPLATYSTGTLTTDFDVAFAVAQFNPTLGTLTGVNATWAWRQDTSGSLTNTSATSQTFRFSASYFTELAGPGVSDFGQGNFYSNLALTLAPGASATLTPQSATGGGAVSFTNLAAFTGTGTTAVNCLTLDGTSFAGGGNNIATNLVTTGSCSLSLEYVYTAAPVTTVPEPTSLALVGLALAGAGLVARRRKA